MKFTITYQRQEYEFELCHSRDWALTCPDAGFFWACEDPDEESYPHYFATQAEAMQHAMQWVRDTVLAENMAAEAEEYDPRYRSLGSVERLSRQQLGL